MSTLFISDLHLSPSRPELTRCFLDFVHQHAAHADALYVLGDLFDFWLGDNDNSEFACQIRDAFRFLTSRGVACYFCHGNRDFLVGKRFAKETGVTLLDTEHRISLYGREAVVLHGDTLCTDDQQYLAFRAKVHQPWLQWLFIRIPMFIRTRIVADIQGKAKESKHSKDLSIMDVNAEEVLRVMNDHRVDLMIHGHTHRPATHSLMTEQGESERIVLPDWNEFGYALSVSPDERKELKFPVK